jgi:peptide subunit release factor RF-3
VESALEDEPLQRCLPLGANMAKDDQGRRIVLFTSEWSMQYMVDKNPTLRLLESPDR